MLAYDTTLEIWKEKKIALNHVFILMPIWKIKTQIVKKIPNYTNVHLERQMNLIKELDTTLENSQWELQDDIWHILFEISHKLWISKPWLILRQNFENFMNFAI